MEFRIFICLLSWQLTHSYIELVAMKIGESQFGDKLLKTSHEKPTSEKIFISKPEYILNNPVKRDLCTCPEEYKWISAKFYEEGKDGFNMLTHYKD